MGNKIKSEHFPALWVETVNGGDADAVLALYNEAATLVPTFSEEILQKPVEVRDYFVALAQKEAQVILDASSVISNTFKEQYTVLTGFYTFEFNVGAERKSFPSRFTFVVDLTRKKPILHHHSSQVPEALSWHSA